MINNLFVPAILTKTKKNLCKRGYRIEDQMLRDALEFARK
jgi:hypothetical protein